jgi:hypothetical protein
LDVAENISKIEIKEDYETGLVALFYRREADFIGYMRNGCRTISHIRATGLGLILKGGRE